MAFLARPLALVPLLVLAVLFSAPEAATADTVNITYRASGRVATILNEQVQRSEQEGLNYSRQTLISQAILGYFGSSSDA